MKRFAVVALKSLGWLLLLLLVLALAWLAFNNRFTDNKPVPVPEALRVAPVSLAPERNAFFGLQALAGDGRSWPTDKQWNCGNDLPACVAAWRADPQGMATLLAGAAEAGARCEAQVASGRAYEEVLNEPRPELKNASDQYAALPLPHFQPIMACQRWLHIKAVLAQGRGDAAAVERALQQTDTLLDGLLSGSRTLIGHMIAWSMAQRHFQLLTLMAAADSAHIERYAPHLRALPDRAREAAPWAPAEAYFSRQIVRELALGCERADASADIGPDTTLRCGGSFFLMPEATTQLNDGLWLQVHERGREGGPLALVDWSPQLAEGLFFGTTWRNSIGHILIAVASGGHTSYFNAHADLLLSHAAAGLALRAAADRPADPAAWLAAQGLDPRLLARLRIENGAVLAKRWREQSDKPAELVFPIPKTSQDA